MELVSDSICPSDQSYYGSPAESNNCCGEFLSGDGSCGVVFGDRETSPPHLPFPLAHTTLLSATEQQ